MSNFPRFGRARNRPSVVARPVSAAAQPPAAEPKPEIRPFSPATQTLEPYLDPNPVVPAPAPASPLIVSPRRLPSPVKRATSPSASPKYEDFVTRVPSPPPVKVTRSPPVSPESKYSDRRNGQTKPPHSPEKSRRTSPPPLSPLALPRTQVTAVNGTTTQPRIQPEVEQKKIVYNKTVEKPAKSDRPSEYGSGKPPQKQQAEVINLTGHNVGAVMEINQSSSAGHRLGGETTKKNETEGGGVHHGNDEKKTAGKKKSPMTPFMNSNFQSVNNSVLYDSSCNHRDPGLHLAFSDAVDGDGATVAGGKNYKP